MLVYKWNGFKLWYNIPQKIYILKNIILFSCSWLRSIMIKMSEGCIKKQPRQRKPGSDVT